MHHTNVARIGGFAFSGIEAVPVQVEARIGGGLPAFRIAGLADRAADEVRERVRAAITAMGLSLPPRRVLIDLTPAGSQEEGRRFDLPVAVAVLAAMDVLPRDEVEGYAALGGLSPDGAVVAVAGVLPAALSASARDLGLICPAVQGGEAAWAGRIEVLAAPHLLNLVNHFRGTQVLTPPEPPGVWAGRPGPDLADVPGMETAKRALEVAAAGNHNLLLVGPAGAERSMLAACLPGLLPDLAPEAALEASVVHSVAGLLEGGRLVTRPPWRALAPGASRAALVGGGQHAGLGEVSLSHRGTLFLDELPEFPRTAQEALRQPLESGCVMVAHGAAHVAYPARFQLITAAKPCPCGHLGDAGQECGKAPSCGEDYLARVSAPLMDRIDLIREAQPVTPSELSRVPRGEPSAMVAERVAAARRLRQSRSDTHDQASDFELDVGSIELENDVRRFIEHGAERLRLSARGLARILRVSRTIADLGGAKEVRRADVAEALAYRHRIPGRAL